MSGTRRFSEPIRRLAARALASGSLGPLARQAAAARLRCPVDYMRYAEFDAVSRDLRIEPGQQILDVGGPQWFPILLADRHRNVRFTYVNLEPRELEPFCEIASALGLRNLSYCRADARSLPFPPDTFDLALSISVIEHISPPEGGDLLALQEVRRVLKPGGEALLTLPCKAKAGLVYLNLPDSPDAGSEPQFFAREYDEKTLKALLERLEMQAAPAWFICERNGWLAVDYDEWGPGKETSGAKIRIRVRGFLERLLRTSLEETLAARYLVVEPVVTGRIVNVGICLRKGSTAKVAKNAKSHPG